MNNSTPGKEFGAWVKSKRQAKQTVARIFAGLIGLSPAEYAEVEAGIVKWVRDRQKLLIPLMLGLNEDEEAQFNNKLSAAQEAGPVEFEDVFTRDQLSPVRLCSPNDERLTPELKEAILNAVFTPLS